MNVTCVAEGNRRLFPRMTESFYRDQPAFSGFTYSPGVFDAFRRADASGKAIFTRLMAAHLEWFTAEVGGMFEKADYYREDTLRALRLHGDTAECWASGAQSMGFGEDGPAFRRHFTTEVVLDSYAGVFLGQINAGLKPMERPLVQFFAIARLLKDLRLLAQDEERQLVDPLVAAASKQGGLDFMLEAARRFPGQREYANRALGQVHVSATSRLKAAESATQRLAIIDETIAATERVRTAAPWCAGCYQLIGIMEHERAVLLVTQKSLRAACEAIARAASYAGPAAVVDTKDQLDQIHAALQQRVAQIRSQMAATPNSQLTAQGSELVAMADGAKRDAEAWEKSPQAKEIATLRDAAENTKSRDLLGEREGLTPLVRIQTSTKVPSAPRFADWLQSNRGRWVRRQMAAAAALLLVTVSLATWQGWAAHSVNAALERVDKAVDNGKDAEALDALGDYFSAPRPLNADRSLDPEMAALYRTILARWAAGRAAAGGVVSDRDQRRINRYGKLIGNPSGSQAGQ